MWFRGLIKFVHLLYLIELWETVGRLFKVWVDAFSGDRPKFVVVSCSFQHASSSSTACAILCWEFHPSWDLEAEPVDR